MHLGIIGYGNIGRSLMQILLQEAAALTRVTVLSWPENAETTRAALRRDFPGPSEVVIDAQGLIAAQPKLVVECAGHAAVQANATAVLRAGIETVIVSIGALADDVLFAELKAAAQSGRTRMVLPAGAIGGVDILSALRTAGVTKVTYTGRKHPSAWIGTPAEKLIDLAALQDEQVFFIGSARDAALQYPKNANVAATLALAGLGWDETRVRLVADPNVTRNIHEFAVCSTAADFSMRIEGHPSPDNPKTSVTTVHAVAREVLNRLREVAI